MQELWLEVLVISCNVDPSNIATVKPAYNANYISTRLDLVDAAGDVIRIEHIVKEADINQADHDHRQKMMDKFPIGAYVKVKNLPSPLQRNALNTAVMFPFATSIISEVFTNDAFEEVLKAQYCSTPKAIYTRSTDAAKAKTPLGRESLMGIIMSDHAKPDGNTPAAFKVLACDQSLHVVRIHTLFHFPIQYHACCSWFC
jgi:hypothetical protein